MDILVNNNAVLLCFVWIDPDLSGLIQMTEIWINPDDRKFTKDWGEWNNEFSHYLGRHTSTLLMITLMECIFLLVIILVSDF